MMIHCCHKNLIGTQIQKERVGYSKTLPVKKYQLQVGEDDSQFTRFPVVEGSCFALASGFCKPFPNPVVDVHLVRVVVVMQKICIYIHPTRWATIYQLELGVK